MNEGFETQNIIEILTIGYFDHISHFLGRQVMANIHLDNYLRIIVEVLPDTLKRLEGEISNREEKFSKMTPAAQDDFLGFSYAYATNQLRACCDALRTLEFLSHKSKESLEVNVTQNGVAGLLRQSLESMATHKWLTDYSTEEEARQKAHSYQLVDLQERANYYKDLGYTEEYGRTIALLESTKRIGLEKGFSKEGTNSNGEPIVKQAIPLLNVTDLCLRIVTPDDVISKEVLKHYPGMANASWLYRWSSGLAHGKFWVNLFQPLDGDLKRTVPNYLNLSVLLLTLIKNIEATIGTS